MTNLDYILVSSIVTVIGMTLISILTGFKIWKVLLNIFLLSSVGFCIIGGLGRRSENHGFDGEWGAHGIWMEFLNSETILISLGVGFFVTFFIFICIFFSDNNK